MNNIWRLSFALLLFFLVACVTNTDSTPTPFPGFSTVASGAKNPLISVEISELATNPERYEGSLVAVNGRYHPIAFRICSSSQYKSPSTWGLTAGESMVHMSGYGAQLRSLLPKETSMAVTGIWRQWRGPVGCGKDAVVQSIWYLDVQKINSPNPLASITLTPTVPGETTEIAASDDSPGSQEQPALTPAPFSEETTPTNSPTNPEGPDSTPSTINATATTLATPALGIPTITSTPTSTATGDGEDVSAQETAVATNTTAPASTTNPSMTATPTPNSSGSGNPSTPRPTINPLSTSTPVPPINTVAKGEILPHDFYEVVFKNLAANEIHNWEVDVFEVAIFTVYIAGDPDIDIIISVLDEDDNIIIDQQNSSSPNEIEVAVLNNLPVGTYQIQIEADRNIAGHYAAAILTNSVFFDPMDIKGILEDGDTVTSTVAEDTDDIWFFYAEAGDIVTISVAPTDGNADMYLVLYNNDVDPDIPLAEVDSITLGATEELTDYEIPQDGVYMIHVADSAYDGAEYVITLTVD